MPAGSGFSELDPEEVPEVVPDVRSADTYFLDPEKIVWHLPDIGSRLIEEPA